MENLNIALLLMVVGMATVFAILLIVIYLGKMSHCTCEQICTRRSGTGQSCSKWSCTCPR